MHKRYSFGQKYIVWCKREVMDEKSSYVHHNDSNFVIHNINNKLFLENMPGIVLISLLMIVGIPGNITALFVYLQKYKPSTYRTFIVCLAMVDLATCCISMPFIIVILRYPILFINDKVCKVFSFLTYVPCVGSVFILITIAVERYRKICVPHGTQISERMSKYFCILDLLAACLVSWPAAVINGTRSYESGVGYINGTACSVSDEFANTKYPAYFRIVTVFVLFTSLMVVTIIYSLVGKQIFRMKKISFGTNRTQSSQDSTVSTQATKFSSVPAEGNEMENYLDGDKNEFSPVQLDDDTRWNIKRYKTIRITRVLFVITVVLACSFIPFLVLCIIAAVDTTFLPNLSFSGMAAYQTFRWTFYISNVANPIIYGFFDRKFMEQICRFYRSLSGICFNRK